MLIGVIINVKSAFVWASHVDLSLHLSHHDGNRGIAQTLVLLLLVVHVCCRVGISSNDIDLEVVYFMNYSSEKPSNTIRCLHCLLVVEMAYTTP